MSARLSAEKLRALRVAILRYACVATDMGFCSDFGGAPANVYHNFSKPPVMMRCTCDARHGLMADFCPPAPQSLALLSVSCVSMLSVSPQLLAHP